MQTVPSRPVIPAEFTRAERRHVYDLSVAEIERMDQFVDELALKVAEIPDQPLMTTQRRLLTIVAAELLRRA